ncbi:BON domain-containing protein [Prosthecobacter sp.]|jgi:osmotically-inducible protein OsmY|uniref:BON domain-containing protein n=1 Tax=Prosthecobacter sp. TaxID=1965333 RepID=UPI0037CA61D4
MKSTIEKSDTDLKNDILSELKFEPNVRTTDIGVLVDHGTVTLNGFATSYSEKWDAVRATKRVAGVNALADDIKVKLLDGYCRTDGDIAAAAANQIRWSSTVPADVVLTTVRDGWITLDGEVEWWYQKNDAEKAVENVMGVKGVCNQITIKPKLSADKIDSDIRSAFERSALLDAGKITVETSGNQVTLTGKVRNYAEKEEAERVAWAAPGVYSVDNQLSVKWAWLE